MMNEFEVAKLIGNLERELGEYKMIILSSKNRELKFDDALSGWNILANQIKILYDVMEFKPDEKMFDLFNSWSSE